MNSWLTAALVFALILSRGQVDAAADISVGELTCEYKTNPLGMDVR